MSTTYNFVPGSPAYDLEYQHVRLGEYVERDDGIVGIIVKSTGSSWREFVPLARTQDDPPGVAQVCSSPRRYRRLNATVQIES